MIQDHARAQGRISLGWWLLVVIALGGGCEWIRFGERTARPVPLVSLETRLAPGAVLGVDRAGRLWLAAGDSLQLIEAASGRLLARFPLGAEGSLRVVGEAGGWMYLHVGDRLLALDSTAGVRGTRRQAEGSPVTLDPRGRHLYAGTASGAVYGLDLATLEPLWAWPRLGRETTALASSPEGDRLYQALRAAGEATTTRLLGRDVQTGRVITEDTLPFVVHALARDANGMLYGLIREGPGGSLASFLPGPGGVRVLWRRQLASFSITGPAELRVSPRGDRMALFSPGEEIGLHLLAAGTGEPLRRVRGEVLDATFGADGALYLLFAEEIRVLR